MRVIVVLFLLGVGCATPPTRLSLRPSRDTFPTEPKLVRVVDDVEDLIPRGAQVAMLMGMSPVAIAKEEGLLRVRATWLDDWATANAEAAREDALDALERQQGYGKWRRNGRRLELAAPKVFRTLTITTVIGEGTATVSVSVVACERERDDLPMKCKDPHRALVGPEHEAYREFLRALQYSDDPPEPKRAVRYFGPSPI